MTEQEQLVREKIAQILYGDTTYKQYLAIPKVRQTAELKINQILSLPEIAILHPDQSLPENPPKDGDWGRIVDDMLNQNWRRVIEK